MRLCMHWLDKKTLKEFWKNAFSYHLLADEHHIEFIAEASGMRFESRQCEFGVVVLHSGQMSLTRNTRFE